MKVQLFFSFLGPHQGRCGSSVANVCLTKSRAASMTLEDANGFPEPRLSILSTQAALIAKRRDNRR